MRISSTALRIFALFLLFFCLVAGAYTWSRHHYSIGEGLDRSVKQELLVMLRVEANADLHIDLQPAAQAVRLVYGQESTEIALRLKNLGSNTEQYRVRVKVSPPENESHFHWELLANPATLAAGHSTEIKLPLRLQRDEVVTHDGTVLLDFSLEPVL